MKSLYRLFFVSAALVGLVAQAGAVQEGEISRSFKNVKEIKIKTVSGDCIIRKGDGAEVKVELTYTFNDSDYDPEFNQSGDQLVLTERFRGRHNSGRSTWKLTVPEETDIDFSTASGNLEVEGLNSKVEAKTASGNISLVNISGEFDASTASGDIDGQNLQGTIDFSTASGDVFLRDVSANVEMSTASGNIRIGGLKGEVDMSTASGNIDLSEIDGEFEVSAASGDIDASDVVLNARSSFSAASGDIEIKFKSGPQFDLQVSTASGDALVNFNNNPIQGFITMRARATKGRIQAPFDFDEEEVYYEGGREYVRKTVKKGSDQPSIEISTASGKAVLLEK